MDKIVSSKAAALKTTAVEVEKLGADKVDGIRLDKGSVYECSVDGKNWIKFEPSGEGYVEVTKLAKYFKDNFQDISIRIDKAKIIKASGIIKEKLLISATVDNVSINGAVNETIPSPYNPTHPNDDVIIKLSQLGAFNAIGAGTDVSSWFKNMPAGLNAKIKGVNAGDQKANIVITGIVMDIFIGAMQIVIPGAVLKSKKDISVRPNPDAIFNLYAIN